jgi:hypothetical protein
LYEKQEAQGRSSEPRTIESLEESDESTEKMKDLAEIGDVFAECIAFAKV